MRSLVASLFGRETGPNAADATRGRPEALRRRIIANTSLILLVVSATALPVAVLLLIRGTGLPFLIAMIGLGAGAAALFLRHRGHFDHAALAQVSAILAISLVLTLADPQIVDFGLAVGLLAPIHASLLTRGAPKRAWLLLSATVLIGCLGSLGSVHWPDATPSVLAIAGGLSFLVAVALVAFAATRVDGAFADYERSQINAYRHLVENVQDAVMRFADDGAVVFTSKSAEKLFGCRGYELAGTGLIDRIHVLDRPAYMTAFSAANHGGTFRSVEVRMRRDSPLEPTRVPQFIWIEVGLTPVIDADARQERHEVVALLRDVTDRHAHEIEMREARRAAEDASNAKSRFLATIGHELRTPLNAIVGFSEMMTSGVVGELSPAHREYAQIIHQSGHHLLDVVKMLLDMSRLEAGKFELQTEAFSPEEVVAPCLTIVEPMARDRRVKLIADLPKLLPQLTGDERACRQIVINLLSNAIKFSHEGGVVTLSMKRQGSLLNISVSDRGIGMDHDALSRIGEPFFQAQDGLSRRYEGTGLGLSIVKGLVDLHQGSLKAISAVGEGTTVTVLLPLNGPETKPVQNGDVTPLIRDPAVAKLPQWQDEKRRAL